MVGGVIMIDPSSRLDRELKAADECFALSRNLPFYARVLSARW
jgi:hypothetical protein